MAIIVGIIGLARPTATVTLPADYMTLVMAVDVSRSMLAEDVEPNRIKAAQAAVKEFIRELPVDIRVGIVSFAGTAQVVQADEGKPKTAAEAQKVEELSDGKLLAALKPKQAGRFKVCIISTFEDFFLEREAIKKNTIRKELQVYYLS
jgi:hypothetical protein